MFFEKCECGITSYADDNTPAYVIQIYALS